MQRRGLTEAAIERGLVENSWRGTRKDDDERVQGRGGKARGEDKEDLGGWDKVHERDINRLTCEGKSRCPSRLSDCSDCSDCSDYSGDAGASRWRGSVPYEEKE